MAFRALAIYFVRVSVFLLYKTENRAFSTTKKLLFMAHFGSFVTEESFVLKESRGFTSSKINQFYGFSQHTEKNHFWLTRVNWLTIDSKTACDRLRQCPKPITCKHLNADHLTR